MEEHDHKEAFTPKMMKIAIDTKGMFVMNNDQRKNVLQQLKIAKAKPAKDRTRSDYRKLKRFDILTALCEDKLIERPKSANATEFKYVVSVEEMFDIIRLKHAELQHRGRDGMFKELKKRYYNVTMEAVALFLTYCSTCQLKKTQAKKGLVVRPIISNELNSRCQIDLIDMQSQAVTVKNQTFRHILVYQDHLTKFTQLRALESKTASEVALHLKHMFSIFGAPHILQSDNGKEFVAGVITELLSQWPGCKLVHGRPRHSQSQGSVERANQDIQNMIFSRIRETNDSDWTKALPEVQFAKNRTYHSGIQRTPYNAMFGTEPRFGISSSQLPSDITASIGTEEQFENAWSRVAVGTGSANVEQESGDDCCLYGNEDLDGEDGGQEGITLELEESTDNLHIPENTMHDDFDDCEPLSLENRFSHNSTDHGRNASIVGETSDPHCSVCEKPYSGYHTCRKCRLPCHIICGTTDSTDEGYSSKVVCRHCSRQELVIAERHAAKRKQEEQAQKMCQASNKRFRQSNVGESVLVAVPDLDRGRTDARNIMAVVTDHSDGFYTLGTVHGSLNRKYVRSQFTPCVQKFIVPDDVPNKQTSLREAVRMASLTGGQGYSRCNCKKNCETNSCSCKKALKTCNSKCHGNLSCCNK